MRGLSHSPVGPPSLSACECGIIFSVSHCLAQFASHCLSPWALQPPPCCASSHPSCLCPPLLLVWMNVSSLTPWLLDFHIVRFSGNSGYFLFLNLLLFFFWLCEEVKCFYLCLHLVWKSGKLSFLHSSIITSRGELYLITNLVHKASVGLMDEPYSKCWKTEQSESFVANPTTGAEGPFCMCPIRQRFSVNGDQLATEPKLRLCATAKGIMRLSLIHI